MKASYLWGVSSFALLAGALALQSDARAQVRLPDGITTNRLSQAVKAAGGTSTSGPAELAHLAPSTLVRNGAFISRMDNGTFLQNAATSNAGWSVAGPSALEFTFPAVVNSLYAFDCEFSFPDGPPLTSIQFAKGTGSGQGPAQATPVESKRVVFAIRADQASQEVALKLGGPAVFLYCKILKA